MADVSVEFGAQDTGLEATLKTVQAEMSRLDAEIKSGELSFNELNKAMRNLAQAERVNEQLQSMASATQNAGDQADTASSKIDNIANQTDRAGKEAEDFGEKSEGGFLKMSGAVAAGQLAAEAAMAGIRAAINLAKGAIDEFGTALDLGGRLSDLAARTGEAEGNLLLLERAFQNSGAGAEAVGPAINKLQNFMQGAAEGGAAQTAAMQKLGLSFEELSGKTPIQQLETFAQRISDIEDPTQRTALAMDVFGRSGGELLPLLTNFSGELGTAQGQLGGMVDIMNRNAATFDAVSDKIGIVRGKFTDFAAGILDRMIPAVDAITEALSRIDAAALGQKLADAFLGGTQAMQGFQAAVDAFKIGEFGKAFELIFESIKLQLMQTGNAIITNFTAAFKTVGDIMAEIFRPDGPSFMAIRSAFDFVAGYAKEKIAGAMSDMFASMGPAFAGISESLKQHSDAGAKAAELALQRIPIAAGLAAEDIGNVLANSTQTFKTNLAESESKFFDIGEQSAKVKGLQDEITAAVANTNEEKSKGALIDEKATAEIEKQNAINAQITAEKAQMQGLQNALNAAIASGNALEQETIEKMIQAEEAKKRIKQLTDQYIASGLGEKEAGQLATNLVNSEIAAKAVAQRAKDAKTNFDDAGNSVNTVKKEVERLYETPMDKPAEGFKEEVNLAREQLFKLQRFIGEDLSRMSLSDIINKLGLDTPGLSSSNEQLRTLEKAINDIANADIADITPAVDEAGVNDKLEKVKGYLAGIDKPDATPKMDQNAVSEEANKAKNTITNAVGNMQVDLDVKPVIDQAQLNAQIADMNAQITNNFTGGTGGPGGQGGEGGQGGRGGDATADIESLVQLLSPWTQIISTIRDRLPLQALAY